MADVFISYKRNQKDRVRRIAELLQERGITVWFDANLEAGRGEGFDAEIEREVMSAGCVVVCWTPDAIQSIYVKAEAKKGLERGAFVPVFLEKCALPVPFNAIDTADLSDWKGTADDPAWTRVLNQVTEMAENARLDLEAKKNQSVAAYERVDHQIFPGTLTMLSRRIAALHELDADRYQADLVAILLWMIAIAEKEANYTEQGYELADRQAGGSVWKYWDSGQAAQRAIEIGGVKELVNQLQAALSKSKAVLEMPAP